MMMRHKLLGKSLCSVILQYFTSANQLIGVGVCNMFPKQPGNQGNLEKEFHFTVMEKSGIFLERCFKSGNLAGLREKVDILLY